MHRMKQLITDTIQQYVGNYAEAKALVGMWETPIVKFASAKDPLFRELKHAVGSTHETPQSLLDNAETVISYFIPFSKSIPQSNKTERPASEEWARAYVETNKLIIALNDEIAATLDEKGFDSRVLPPTHNFNKKSLISAWSHKHVAYIAGMGKFGHHHMLITDKGCCGRLGSVITSASIPASTRKQIEYCLYKLNGSCEVCVKRCPFDVLENEIMDKPRCYAVLLDNAERYKSMGLADVCGKCVSITPCSFLNPVKKRVTRNLFKRIRLENAKTEDLEQILVLQKTAYASEAERYGDNDLPPLKQTLAEIIEEFSDHLFLKLELDDRIIGSVRARLEGGTCFIGKLIVHPNYQNLGLARLLMETLEKRFETVDRFELFTGHKSEPALNLYYQLGYSIFSEKPLDTHTLVFLQKKNGE